MIDAFAGWVEHWLMVATVRSTVRGLVGVLWWLLLWSVRLAVGLTLLAVAWRITRWAWGVS